MLAPFSLHDAMLAAIRNEAANARAGKKAYLAAKVNALLDPTVIDALYEASEAGVKIFLNQRLAGLDVLAALAETAALHRYVRPIVDTGDGRTAVGDVLRTPAPDLVDLFGDVIAGLAEPTTGFDALEMRP